MYQLLKIDLLDSYPLADVFDEEKYTLLLESDDITELVRFTIGGFMAENPKMKTYHQWLEKAEDGGYEFIVLTGGKELFRASTILLDAAILASLLLALNYHHNQIRKGDGHPYLEHPLEVAHILWKENFPSDVIAAGYCHDLLEDTDCQEHEIEKECGAEVLRIVKAVSNDEELFDTTDWEKKKSKYIESVRAGGEKAIAVSVADKIANLHSFFDQYEKEGPSLWKKFNRGKEKKVWFEKEVLNMARVHWKHPMLEEFECLIKKLEQTIK